MKLKIQKQPHGVIRVVLTCDTAKAPVVFTVEAYQAPMLQTALEAARQAEKFSFEMELSG